MALETSGELQQQRIWSTDATWQLRGYTVDPFPQKCGDGGDGGDGGGDGGGTGGDGDGDSLSDGMVVLVAFLSFGGGVVGTSVISAVIIYVMFKKQGYSMIG